LNLEELNCFTCKEPGHVSARCPKVLISDNSNLTKNDNISNKEPVPTNLPNKIQASPIQPVINENLQTKRALSEQVIIENSQTKRALSVTNSSDLSNTHSNKDNEIDSEYCDSDSNIELLEISNTKENLQNTYKKAKKIKTDEN